MNSLEKAMLMGWDEEKTPARRNLCQFIVVCLNTFQMH